jgi:hypothetical protein
MGSSVAPESRTARISSGPAITSDSLLANNNRLPARAAASVERNPAAPTMAAMTASTSGNCAISSSAAGPASTRVAAPRARNSCSSLAAAEGSATATCAGRKRKACSASRPTLRCAPSAATWKRSGWRAITSSVCSPTEPVEPSMATPIVRTPFME